MLDIAKAQFTLKDLFHSDSLEVFKVIDALETSTTPLSIQAIAEITGQSHNTTELSIAKLRKVTVRAQSGRYIHITYDESRRRHEFTLKDTIPQEFEEDIDPQIMNEILRVSFGVRGLNIRNHSLALVMAVFGKDITRTLTKTEIAAETGLTREQVRRALNKLEDSIEEFSIIQIGRAAKTKYKTLMSSDSNVRDRIKKTAQRNTPATQEPKIHKLHLEYCEELGIYPDIHAVIDVINAILQGSDNVVKIAKHLNTSVDDILIRMDILLALEKITGEKLLLRQPNFKYKIIKKDPSS